jgi:hypothetical protein
MLQAAMMPLLDQVLVEFPEHARIMRRLYLSDENFRSICEDLALATKELRDAAVSRVAPDRRAELSALRDALSRELITYVGRADRGRDAG